MENIFKPIQFYITENSKLYHNKSAIKCGSDNITYEELENRANILAKQLLNLNIQKGEIIALLFSPSIEFIISVLGILKVGAVYVPLSTNYPLKRIENIIEDANCKLIISDSKIDYFHNLTCNSLIFNEINFNVTPSEVIIDIYEDDLAYILYTSGSTGLPKGVMVTHKNLAYYSNWAKDFFSVTINNLLPLTSDINFAAAVSQIYACLLAGKTLCILRDSLNNPEKLFDFYTKNSNYGFYCVPSVWRLALEWYSKIRNIKSKITEPKVLFLSGEDISGQLIEETNRIFPELSIWNLYGPTEAVANLSFKQILSMDSISIGSPIPNTKFYVINEKGNEANIGEQGILYASSPCISIGYWNNDELTNKSFFTFNSKNDGEIPVYNTGDIVKIIDENEYQYIGRKDQQIKLNGQRIELGEIEKLLDSNPNVTKSIVMFYNNNISAYIKGNSSEKADIDNLRNDLMNYLPSSMLPSNWIFVDEFPYLPNGKIDRKSILQIKPNSQDSTTENTSQLTEIELNVLSIFENVLGIQDIGLNTNFFNVGGNSLKVISILIEIEEVFSLRISIQKFFDNPTPLSIIEILKKEPNNKSNSIKLDKKYSAGRIELSKTQKALLLFSQLNPKNTSYNIAYAIKLTGMIELDNLNKAINKVISTNELLSSKLVLEYDLPVFEIEKKNINLNLELLDEINFNNRLSFINESISELAILPFEFGDDLFRFKLYQLDENEYILGFVVSHIIFDGESLPNFIEQLSEYYGETETKSISPKFDFYPNILEKKFEYEKTEKYKSDLDFWKKYLNGVKSINNLPEIYNNKFYNQDEAGTIESIINTGIRAELGKLSKDKNITLNMLLLSVLATTISKFSHLEELLIAMPFSNRLTYEQKKCIAYLSNTLFIRINCSNNKQFGQLVEEVKSDLIQLLDHQETPLEELIKILREEGSIKNQNGFEILFAYHQSDKYAFETENLKIKTKEVPNKKAKCKLQFECFDDNETISLKVTYDKSKIDESFAIQIVRVFKQILQNITINFNSNIQALPLIWENEKNIVLRNSIGHKIKYNFELTLFNLFEETVEKYAENIAINYYHSSITYVELHHKINKTISFLNQLSLRKEEPVAIYMDNTPELLVSILACSALSIPYIPLDPTFPNERNLYILEDAGSKYILTTSDLKSDIEAIRENIINIDDVLENSTAILNIEKKVSQDDLLYVIYTSGSTGNPKGVMVSNKGVCNYLLWMREAFDIDYKSKILAKTSISFDISVWELFLPLIAGGTLVLKKRADLESPEQIATTIKDYKVTIVQFVPSGLRLFNDAKMFKTVPDLKIVFCGGERLSTTLKEEVLSEFNGSLYNLYGPTEASIFMTYFKCIENTIYNNIPIGKPIFNSSIYILDEFNNIVPRCFPGKVFIGGNNLAYGYWNNKELTEKTFHKLSNEIFSEILYEVGDLGRMLMDGNIEFLGRNDQQIKIRGYRVELGEIEKVIYRNQDIVDVVVYKDSKNEIDERINALIVANNPINFENLKKELSSKLPKYMVPSSIKQVPEIPKLPNGKIDFKNLQQKNHNFKSSNLKYINNRENEIETTIFKIWSEVIGHEEFSLEDNFFDAGGHSVLFLEIQDKLSEILKINFSLIELYQHPNIKSIAAEYRRKYENKELDVANSIRNRVLLKKQSYGRNGRK